MQVIYAYNPNTPASETSVGYHGQNKGATPLRLYAPSDSISNLPSDVTHFDLTVNNLEVPFDGRDPTTTYWVRCVVVRCLMLLSVLLASVFGCAPFATHRFAVLQCSTYAL